MWLVTSLPTCRFWLDLLAEGRGHVPIWLLLSTVPAKHGKQASSCPPDASADLSSFFPWPESKYTSHCSASSRGIYGLDGYQQRMENGKKPRLLLGRMLQTRA